MKYMPMGYFNAQSLGSLTAVATSTMEDLESMSFAVIARTVVGMIRTTIFSLAVLCFDWRIGLIFLLGMLLFLWVNSLLLKNPENCLRDGWQPPDKAGGRCAGIHTGHERGTRLPWR